MPIEQSVLVLNSYFGEIGANKVSLFLSHNCVGLVSQTYLLTVSLLITKKGEIRNTSLNIFFFFLFPSSVFLMIISMLSFKFLLSRSGCPVLCHNFQTCRLLPWLRIGHWGMPVHLTGLQFYIQTFVMGLNRNLSFLVTGINMEVKKKNLYGGQCV